MECPSEVHSRRRGWREADRFLAEKGFERVGAVVRVGVRGGRWEGVWRMRGGGFEEGLWGLGCSMSRRRGWESVTVVEGGTSRGLSSRWFRGYVRSSLQGLIKIVIQRSCQGGIQFDLFLFSAEHCLFHVQHKTY